MKNIYSYQFFFNWFLSLFLNLVAVMGVFLFLKIFCSPSSLMISFISSNTFFFSKMWLPFVLIYWLFLKETLPFIPRLHVLFNCDKETLFEFPLFIDWSSLWVDIVGWFFPSPFNYIEIFVNPLGELLMFFELYVDSLIIILSTTFLCFVAS